MLKIVARRVAGLPDEAQRTRKAPSRGAFHIRGREQSPELLRHALVLIQCAGIASGFSRSFGTKWRARGRTASATRAATLARSAAAMNAWEIPAEACGPARTPVPAAIVEKTATPIVPPIS